MSEEERSFMLFWEANREKEKKTWWQLLVGLPLGLIFTLPILINLFSGWDKRAAMVANTQLNPVVLIVAVLAIAAFFAIFNNILRISFRLIQPLKFVIKPNLVSVETY